MKKITAITRLHKLDEIKLSLVSNGVIGMTISEIHQFGWQKGQDTLYRGIEISIDFLPKIEIELIVNDDQEDAVVKALLESASTGEVGDGKIFISPVEDIIRIRTEERGLEAI